MSLVKRGVLLKNERLKLYKRPSTWILMGVIVLITMLGLFFSRMFITSYQVFNPTWQEQYNSHIEEATWTLKDNPDDVYAKQTLDTLKYLTEKKIPPQDWRTDVVIEYYELKYNLPTGGDMYGDIYKGLPQNPVGDVKRTDEEIQSRLEKLDALLKSKDWKEYINLKISDLESGWTQSANEQEKQVDIDMYKLYIKQGIVPDAQRSYQYYYGNGDEMEQLTWKNRQVQLIRNNKLNLLRGENNNGDLLTNTQRKSLENEIEVALKRLSTETPPVLMHSFLGMLESAASSLGILSILLIVYAGNIFASEYGSGTIKLLLITPHKRKKIFWAKALLMLELAAIALAAIFVLAFLISGVFTGFKGIGSMQVLSLFGEIVYMPYLLYIVLYYLLLMLPVIAYGALAMMMSVVTRKSSVSIAVTMLIMFGGEIMMDILTAISGRTVLPGAKFLLFANTRIENYLPSAQSAFNVGGMMGMVDSTMTLMFTIAVLTVYTVCFLWIARDSFCRRDVK